MVELVGRSDALRRVEVVLADARRSKGGLLVVSGAPGTGRSAVLAQAGIVARSAGMRVEAVRAHPFDREAGLEVVRRLLTPVVEAHPDLVADGQAAWARPLFHPVEGEIDYRAVSRGLTWLIERAVERIGPMALVVDDLHRADVASVRVLAEVAALAADLALAIVVAHQPGDGAAGTAHLLGLGQVVTLGALDDEAVAALIAAGHGRAPSPEVVAAVQGATAGLPALVVPFLEAADAEGAFTAADVVGVLDELAPPRLPERIRARLDDVGTDALAVALAAAVLADEPRVDVLAAAAEIEVHAVGPAMAELVDAGLFRPGPKPAWATPLLGRAARSMLGDGTRGLIATRAARAMHEAGDAPSSVASLLVDAPPVAELWAAAALAAAAHEAEARGAPEVARELWLRQMDEPLDHFGRGWAMASVARAEMHLGDPAGLPRFRELAPMIDDAGLRARVRYATGRASLWNLDAAGSAAAFELAAADALAANEEEIAWRALAGQLMAATIGSLGDDEVGRLVAALPSVDDLDAAGASSIGCAHAVAALALGRPADEVRARARRGVSDDRLFRLPTSDFTALTGAAVALAAAGCPTEAVAVVERLIAVARSIGQVSSAATVSASLAPMLLAAGRISDAVDSAEDALADPHAWPIERPAAAAALADARRLQGDLDLADAVLGRHPIGPAVRPRRTAELQWLVAAARVALDAGEGPRAQALCEEALQASQLARAFGAGEVLVRALHASGDIEGARARAAQLIEETSGASVAVRAGALVVSGRVAGDVAQVSAGASLVRGAGAPIASIAASIELGHEHLRIGQKVPARDAFREALGLADQIGAKGQANAAIDGLRLAGGRPRRAALTGIASLTPSEERICRLVAQGRSNREVAESLFLSRKTIEYHLVNAYGKLGVARREELAAALAPPLGPGAAPAGSPERTGR